MKCARGWRKNLKRGSAFKNSIVTAAHLLCDKANGHGRLDPFERLEQIGRGISKGKLRGFKGRKSRYEKPRFSGAPRRKWVSYRQSFRPSPRRVQLLNRRKQSERPSDFQRGVDILAGNSTHLRDPSVCDAACRYFRRGI